MNTEMSNRISIIIPVFNEELAIEQVLSDVLENYKNCEVIVVDDGSTDTTRQRLGKFDVSVISHKTNKGYGAALKTGIRNATKDIIITIDADGEHSVKDIELLLAGVDSFDMLVGKRTTSVENKLWKKIGKIVLHKTANLAAGLFIPDINSGLRVFKKSAILNYLDILPDSFSFHTTSTLLFIFNNCKIKYMPIKAYPRKGNSKVSVNSGIASLKKIITITSLFKPLRLVSLFFYPLSAIILLILLINFLVAGKNFLYSLLILTAVFLFVLPIDILSRSKKNLILDMDK